jgi:hypothetical protein
MLLVFGCGADKEKAAEGAAETAPEAAATEATADAPVAQRVEPDYITVQHILVGFEGTVPGKPITRSKEEAEQLANELLERARGGEDFDALVREYTNDSHPGIYKMANRGVAADRAQQVFAREQMVAAFGDVGFPLAAGEIGLAPYDKKTSPYGWHVIKRIE